MVIDASPGVSAVRLHRGERVRGRQCRTGDPLVSTAMVRRFVAQYGATEKDNVAKCCAMMPCHEVGIRCREVTRERVRASLVGIARAKNTGKYLRDVLE